MYFGVCRSSRTASPSITMIVSASDRTPETSFVPLILPTQCTCVLSPYLPPATIPWWNMLDTLSRLVPWYKSGGILMSPTSSSLKRRKSISMRLLALDVCPCCAAKAMRRPWYQRPQNRCLPFHAASLSSCMITASRSARVVPRYSLPRRRRKSCQLMKPSAAIGTSRSSCMLPRPPSEPLSPDHCPVLL